MARKNKCLMNAETYLLLFGKKGAFVLWAFVLGDSSSQVHFGRGKCSRVLPSPKIHLSMPHHICALQVCMSLEFIDPYTVYDKYYVDSMRLKCL